MAACIQKGAARSSTTAGSGHVALLKRTGGTFDGVGYSATVAQAAVDSVHRLEARAEGSTIEVRWDGVLLFTATDQTSYASATQHGLLWHSDDTDTELDNFEVVGVPTATVCTTTVSPGSLTPGAGGSTGTLTVTSGSGCFWAVSTPASWVTFGTLAGTGSGTTGYTVAPNAAAAGRSAVVTIAGATVTVTQAGTGTPSTPPSPPSGGGTPAGLPEEPPAGTALYYHADAIGSVRLITDQAGNAVQRHDFLPFGTEVGAPTDTAKNPLRFAGKERDVETASTGGALEPLSYFGARHYQNQIGRFTTVDPVITWSENLVDPQRWNRYVYVRNNPLRFVDPDGRCIQKSQASYETSASDLCQDPTKLGVDDSGRDFIKRHEGNRGLYRDTAGLATVGWGHRVQPGESAEALSRMTPGEQEALFASDVAAAERAVRRGLNGLPVSQNEFNALVDLVFNVGPAVLTSARSPSLMQGIRSGNYGSISSDLMYTKDVSGGSPPGLRNRSEERTLMFLGIR